MAIENAGGVRAVKHGIMRNYIKGMKVCLPSGEIVQLGGKLVSYGRSSEVGFYIPVIFEFDNRGNFVSGSYVDVWLRTSVSGSCIAVPLAAVVEDQGVHYVFVREADDDDCFEKREVRLGQSDGHRVPVLQGLQEGEFIVTEGAMHVKLAGVAAVPAGHSHNH